MKNFADNFWDKVNIKGEDDCWEWKVANHNKYPTVKLNKRTHSASKIAWILSGRSIEVNKLLLHKCDNKKCVNPNHLYLGTYGDNMTDRCSRYIGRIGKVGRYSRDEINKMIQMFNSGIPRNKIIDTFGISRRYLYKLISGEMGVNSK